MSHLDGLPEPGTEPTLPVSCHAHVNPDCVVVVFYGIRDVYSVRFNRRSDGTLYPAQPGRFPGHCRGVDAHRHYATAYRIASAAVGA